MSNLAQRQDKFQEKMMDISFDQFIDTYASWCPLMLYKRDTMITQYPDTPRSPTIVPPDDFHPNRESFVSYGVEYNSDEDFFVQLEKLRKTVPTSTLFAYGSRENSDYANCIINGKNSYLSITVVDSENVCYSLSIKDGSVNVFNSAMVRDNSQNIYQSIGIIQSYNVFYSKYCHNCTDIWFCTNCIGSTHCLFCDDLENASYCIQNKQYTPEEYEKKKEELLHKNKENFDKAYNTLSNIAKNITSSDSTGQLLIECDALSNWYYSYKIQNGRNTFLVGGKEWDQNIFNVFMAGAPSATNIYGSVWGWMYSDQVYSSFMFDNCTNIWYSLAMADCSYCIGCVWLKNKQFCILNKQYTKEERFTLADQILHDLDKQWKLWLYLPAEMNPFYCNDTMASVIKNYEAKDCVDRGYMWREDKIKTDIPTDAEVVKTSDLWQYESFDDEKRSVNQDILKKIIIDEQWNYYRIVQMEYDFLLKHWLPLPRKHRLDRMKENFRIN